MRGAYSPNKFSFDLDVDYLKQHATILHHGKKEFQTKNGMDVRNLSKFFIHKYKHGPNKERTTLIPKFSPLNLSWTANLEIHAHRYINLPECPRFFGFQNASLECNEHE